jgi:ribosomal protein S18 acetylase RimI-like enzyme
MQFRRATAEDIDAVVALFESAYRGEASRAGWTTEADFLDGSRTDAEDVRQLALAERGMMLLALDDDGGIAACANVAEEDGAGYFGMFSVVPTRQRGGIGSKLLAEAERIVRDDWKLRTMRLTVIDIRAELVAYYERRGYVRTGKKKPFPYDDERFGIPKRDDLRLEVLEKQL